MAGVAGVTMGVDGHGYVWLYPSDSISVKGDRDGIRGDSVSIGV